MTPITRQEMFLNAAAGNEQALPDPITREEMYLKAIADNAGSGSGGLPSVSDVDDGKVLTVVDGAWAPAAASGGGGVLVVHNVDGTLDKTWQEIADADFAVMKTVGADPLSGFDEGSTQFNVVRAAVVLTGGDGYNVTFGFDEYHTDSASGYPVYDDGGGSI